MTSILIVTATPDDRDSTADLRRLERALTERGARAETWFLRAYPSPHPQPWSGTKVVDRLRTRGVTGLLTQLGVPYVAPFARGRRLRSWLRRVGPDLVLLDDGLGERILNGPGPRPITVLRFNATPSAHASLEGAPAGAADLALVDSRSSWKDPAIPARPLYLDHSDVVTLVKQAHTERRRDRHGIPAGAPLVTGWGADGWLDGPDLFIRCLWAIEHRHGIPAHGLWVGVGSDDDRERLEQEARRCGVGERYHLVEGDDADKVCGDAVFLPWRTPNDEQRPDPIGVALALPLTVFPVLELPHTAVSVVDHLDIEAAADSVSEALRDGTRGPDGAWGALGNPIVDHAGLAELLIELAGGVERA